MDEVTGELRRWADEDGGVLFHCRPRGRPPGGVGRELILAVALWPHVSTWSLALWLGWGAGPDLGWGVESPMVDGLTVPWLALAAVGFVIVELVGFARYRSRHVVITPHRVLVARGIFSQGIQAAQRVGLPEVRIGPRGVETWADGWVDLGRLDPLDVQDLVRALGLTSAGEARASLRLLGWAGLFGLLAGVAPYLALLAGIAPNSFAVAPYVGLPIFIGLVLVLGRRR